MEIIDRRTGSVPDILPANYGDSKLQPEDPQQIIKATSAQEMPPSYRFIKRAAPLAFPTILGLGSVAVYELVSNPDPVYAQASGCRVDIEVSGITGRPVIAHVYDKQGRLLKNVAIPGTNSLVTIDTRDEPCNDKNNTWFSGFITVDGVNAQGSFEAPSKNHAIVDLNSIRNPEPTPVAKVPFSPVPNAPQSNPPSNAPTPAAKPSAASAAPNPTSPPIANPGQPIDTPKYCKDKKFVYLRRFPDGTQREIETGENCNNGPVEWVGDWASEHRDLLVAGLIGLGLLTAAETLRRNDPEWLRIPEGLKTRNRKKIVGRAKRRLNKAESNLRATAEYANLNTAHTQLEASQRAVAAARANVDAARNEVNQAEEQALNTPEGRSMQMLEQKRNEAIQKLLVEGNNRPLWGKTNQQVVDELNARYTAAEGLYHATPQHANLAAKQAALAARQGVLVTAQTDLTNKQTDANTKKASYEATGEYHEWEEAQNHLVSAQARRS